MRGIQEFIVPVVKADFDGLAAAGGDSKVGMRKALGLER